MQVKHKNKKHIRSAPKPTPMPMPEIIMTTKDEIYFKSGGDIYVMQNNSAPLNLSKTETHSYDGKLKKRFLYVPQYPKDDKLKSFMRLKETINDSRHPDMYRAKRAIELISSGIDNLSNYDATNDIRADDLLHMIINKMPPTLIGELITQLSDIIAYGSCPQGKCTRLAQIYFALFEKE